MILRSLAARYLFPLLVSLHPSFHDMTPPSGNRYLYIDNRLAMSRTDADAACRALGMSLAAIPDEGDLMWVGGLLGEGGEAWIGEFKGRGRGLCIAAFQGGAVAVPSGSCSGNHAVLCQK